MTKNEQIIHAFAEQFSPPLKYVQTLAINGVKHADAWQCTYWSNTRSIGITAVAFAGQIHAYLEAAGRGDIAVDAGQVIAAALGLATEKCHGQG